MAKNIDKLIINSPYKEPKQHWFYIRETKEHLNQALVYLPDSGKNVSYLDGHWLASV